MHHPYTHDEYYPRPDGTVEIKTLQGNSGVYRVSEDGDSVERVSGDEVMVHPSLLRWALGTVQTTG